MTDLPIDLDKFVRLAEETEDVWDSEVLPMLDKMGFFDVDLTASDDEINP